MTVDPPQRHHPGPRIQRIARTAFALTLVWYGIAGLIKSAFATIWGGVPARVPGSHLIVVFSAIVSLACGAGLLLRRTERLAAAALLVYLTIWLVVVRSTDIIMAPTSTGSWWASGETAVLTATVWVLYVQSAGKGDLLPPIVAGGTGARVAAALYGLGLIPFGVAHFTYFARTESMVPSWLPWHSAWAALTGAAFIAAGIAIVTGFAARRAAVLITWQMGLFTLLVWGPVVLAGNLKLSDIQETIGSWLLTAAGTVFATWYPRRALK